jgi:hypothetical protein
MRGPLVGIPFPRLHFPKLDMPLLFILSFLLSAVQIDQRHFQAPKEGFLPHQQISG